MRVYLKRLLLLAGVVGFFALTIGLPVFFTLARNAFPKAFASKYYDFPEVNIEAWVHPDGSMSVVEHRTYRFQKGDFTFANAVIEHRQPGDIVDVGVSDEHRRYRPYSPFGGPGPLDPGILSVSDASDALTATWHFTAHDETKTFAFSYRALCAVDVYPDGAYLAWQFIPGGVDKPTAHAHVTIHLPGHALGVERPTEPCSPAGTAQLAGPITTTPLRTGEVRAWGHGPLQGNVSFAGPQTVELDIRDLAPNHFVVGSVLFPIDAVPLEEFTSSGVGPDVDAGFVTSAAEVLAQEQRLAADANGIRSRNHVFRVLWLVLAIVYPLLLAGLIVWAYRRDRVAGVPRTTQEPPEDMHPVDLAVLWGSWHHSGLIVQNAYRAELLWLAKQGTIEIRADGQVSDPKDIELMLKDLPTHPLDQEFTQYLFEGSSTGPVALSSLKASGARGDDLRTWWKAVQSKVAWQRSRRHRRWEARAMFWSMVAMLVYSIVAGIVLKDPSRAWLGAFAAFVVWAFARWFLPMRISDPSDRERIARWAAFRRFLKRFSSLPDAPTLAVIVWEKYLVYATALGVAARVAKQVKALVPEERLPAVWSGAPSGLTGFTWANSLSTQTPVSLGMMASASGVSWSGSSGSFSSSSGFSSGGFSSGGGGAGGGGSRGAG